MCFHLSKVMKSLVNLDFSVHVTPTNRSSNLAQTSNSAGLGLAKQTMHFLFSVSSSLQQERVNSNYSGLGLGLGLVMQTSNCSSLGLVNLPKFLLNVVSER